MRTIDHQTLDQLKTRLDNLPPRRNLRPYDVVAGLTEAFDAARGRGYNLADLADLLAHHGIKLTRPTLRTYISRARLERRGTASAPALEMIPAVLSATPELPDTDTNTVGTSTLTRKPRAGSRIPRRRFHRERCA